MTVGTLKCSKIPAVGCPIASFLRGSAVFFAQNVRIIENKIAFAQIKVNCYKYASSPHRK